MNCSLWEKLKIIYIYSTKLGFCCKILLYSTDFIIIRSVLTYILHQHMWNNPPAIAFRVPLRNEVINYLLIICSHLGFLTTYWGFSFNLFSVRKKLIWLQCVRKIINVFFTNASALHIDWCTYSPLGCRGGSILFASPVKFVWANILQSLRAS